MKIIPLNESASAGALFEAVKIARSGGVLVYPTDTVYGIGGNALNQKTAERICRIKKRPAEKGFVILARDLAMARRYAYIDLWAEKILAEIWPGPVTAVLPRKGAFPEALSGAGSGVAIRVSDFWFLNKLFQNIDFPLISTSMNVSGAPEFSSPGAFLAEIKNEKEQPDLTLDAGEINGRPSTILDLTDRRNPLILRHGVVSKTELDKMLSPL